MSVIDSGLGWKCEDKYYVSDAGTFLLNFNGTRTYKKYLDGPAIYFTYRYGASPYFGGPLLASTNPDYCKYQVSGDFNSVEQPYNSVTINGVLWYYNTGAWVPKSDVHSMTSPFQFFNQEEDGISVEERISIITSVISQAIPVQLNHSGGVLSDSFEITVYPS